MAANQGERCTVLFLEIQVSGASAGGTGGHAEGICRRAFAQTGERGSARALNTRYVLAILLERKRTLKQVDIRETAEDKILIYEHVKTGEAFIIPDPRLTARSARICTAGNLFAPGPPGIRQLPVSVAVPVGTESFNVARVFDWSIWIS